MSCITCKYWDYDGYAKSWKDLNACAYLEESSPLVQIYAHGYSVDTHKDFSCAGYKAR
jgi:hypothetical protein